MTKPNWEVIESAYRAGLLSVREIASQHGITHGAINKRAKRDGLERDLKAKIKARADSLVSKREVSTLVSTGKAISERILIEASAEVIANVRMEHRGDIRRARKLAVIQAQR
ncbi:phage protein [Serratia sp. M24T3]|nr:phage protein [Serratia sp. M24T3]